MIISFQFDSTNIYLGLLWISTMPGLRRRENLLLVLRDLGSSWVSFRLQAWESDRPICNTAWQRDCLIQGLSKGYGS